MNARNANQIGKYLYNHIDGAFKYVNSSNTCDVYMTILYQLPVFRRPIGDQDVHEMVIVISITTYANKIRLNVNEVSPEECTLGHVVLDQETTNPTVSEIAIAKVHKFLAKRYADYNFIY